MNNVTIEDVKKRIESAESHMCLAHYDLEQVYGLVSGSQVDGIDDDFFDHVEDALNRLEDAMSMCPGPDDVEVGR